MALGLTLDHWLQVNPKAVRVALTEGSMLALPAFGRVCGGSTTFTSSFSSSDSSPSRPPSSAPGWSALRANRSFNEASMACNRDSLEVLLACPAPPPPPPPEVPFPVCSRRCGGPGRDPEDAEGERGRGGTTLLPPSAPDVVVGSERKIPREGAPVETARSPVERRRLSRPRPWC